MKSHEIGQDHLRPETRAWVASVTAEYRLEDHHARLLLLAAEAWDRCVAAREAVLLEGMVYVDRFGQPHARPEVDIESKARLAFARLVRELGLDLAEPDPVRPPTRQGRKGVV